MYLNSVTIGGRLTRDPELRHTPTGLAVCKFGVALGRKYRDKNNETQEEVTFVDVECWQKLAENVGKYTSKGKRVIVVGRLKLDSWQDKEGQHRQKLYINAVDVQFIDWKEDNRGGSDRSEQQHAGDQAQASAQNQTWNKNEDPGEPPF